MYALTVYRDDTCRDITNEYDFHLYEYLDEAIEYAEQCKLPYSIHETYIYRIYDLDIIDDSDYTVDENVTYWVAPECDNWTEYHWPLKTLAEAKMSAKECFDIEHCNVYIEKHFKRLVKEV